MDFTIEFTSGGNHGHQIKDALGGLTIGKLLGLNYVHTPYPYLDFFAIGYNQRTISKEERSHVYNKVVRIPGPLWCGLDTYEEFVNHFGKLIPEFNDKTLIVFENALRIHPFQTIPWFFEGHVHRNVFAEVQSEISQQFAAKHQLNPLAYNPSLQVAMHINRGTDYDKEKFPHHFSTSFAVRYMFDMDYYERILDHISEAYEGKEVQFHIYTEKENSEAIVARFGNRKNTIIHLGDNREAKNYDQIHQIFKKFVEADILVCSNSSFSVMGAHYRKNRKTVYHPHLQLQHLPEPNYIKTDEHGNLDQRLLLEPISSDRYVDFVPVV